MNPDDLPDERAFQDEFTREFLQSVEETRPGYYPFLSKTGKYKMDFPGDGNVSKAFYRKIKGYEAFSASIPEQGYFTLHFDDSRTIENLPYYLDAFQGRIGKEINLEILEIDSKVIYYNFFHRKNYEHHVAYLHPKNNNGGLEIIYTLDCLEGFNCDKPNSNEKQDILNWIKSIQFTYRDEGKD